MYKLITTLYDDKQEIRVFETAVEARNYYNEHIGIKDVAFIEIFEIEKWTRERLNTHAQLEEECESLQCGK